MTKRMFAHSSDEPDGEQPPKAAERPFIGSRKDLKFLFDVAETIRLVRSTDELLAKIAELTGSLLKIHRCHFNEIDLENDLATVRSEYRRSGKDGTGTVKLSAYSHETADVMRRGSTVINRDSENDPRTAAYFKKTYAKQKELAYVAVPQMKSGKWIGSFWCSDDKPRSWTDAEVALIELIAERTWAAVERLRSEEANRRTEVIFSQLVNAAPFGIYVVDSEMRFDSANDAARGVFAGIEPLIGRSFAEVIRIVWPEPFASEVVDLFRRTLETGEPYRSATTTEQRADTDLVETYDWEIHRIMLPDGRFGVVAYFYDLTEQKRIERALRESQERFTKAFKASPYMLIISDLADGKFIEVNDTFTAVTGFSREESIGRTSVEVGFRRNLDERDADLSVITEHGEMRDREFTFYTKDGREASGLFSAESVEIGGRKCFLAVMQDVSEKKAAEAILQRYRLLSEHARDILWFVRPNGDIVEVNEAGVNTYGYSRDEILRMNVRDFRTRSTHTELERQLDQALETGITFETTHLKKDGTPIPVEVKANGAQFGDEWLILSVIRDMTERSEADAALRASEERLKLAQEAGHVGIWDWDPIAEVTYWSDTMWNIYGHEPQTFNPDEEFWASHIHPEDRERVLAAFHSALNSRAAEYHDVYRIVQKRSPARWIESSATIVRDADSNPARMYGVNLDITEQKLVAERIRNSEAELRLITDVAPALIAYIDRDEKHRFVNHRYSDWFRVDKNALIGKKISSTFGKAACEELAPYLARSLAGEELAFDTWLDLKQAGRRFVHVAYVPDLGPDREVRGVYSFMSDLTDLRHSEDALKFSRERMRILTDSFTDYAIYSTDPDGLIDTWNPGARNIFGYTDREIIGKSYGILFVPEDLSLGMPIREREIAREKGRASDERWHLRKDGTRFFASRVIAPLFQDGTLTGYAVISSDLTERLRFETAQQKAQEELESRVASRTRALAQTNSLLLKQMEERARVEEQRLKLLRTLFTIQEDERGRIARDLHDQLGQRLTALRLKIASVRDLCVGQPELETRVNRLEEIAENIDSEVSFLAWELRPSILDDRDFLPALEQYVKEWSRYSGIYAEFHAFGIAELEIDQDIATNLYRITQEALNNIVKYAKAEQINVLLERQGADLLLIIEDNGKGFDTKAVSADPEKRKGFGLVGMRERASLVGGTLEIESAVDKGTTIFTRVPLSGREGYGR